MMPMLACSTIVPTDQLRLPVIASFKLDGIRAIAENGVAMSRNGKPIPNRHIQSIFKHFGWDKLDGELVLNDKGKDFNDVQSAIMSTFGAPSFSYVIFDDLTWLDHPYCTRYETAKSTVLMLKQKTDIIKIVGSGIVTTQEALDNFYQYALREGYEGLITRDPLSPYKQGRSTLKQQWMMKLKPLSDVEGTIIAIEELEHNLDTSTKKQENKVGGETLGAFVVVLDDGVKVSVGTGKGLTAARRAEFWDDRENLIGKRLTLAYQELSKDGVPRFPRFKGIRYE